MTNSELKTIFETSKVFFKPFTYFGVKYQTNNGEHELCDVLLEYKNFYVAIQIKERDRNKGTINDQRWLSKRVKEAKSQLVNDFDILKQCISIQFTDSSGNNVLINKKDGILPIIVFDNENINFYDHQIFCKRLNAHISIFNFTDFKTMLNCINVPRDIIEYCVFRNNVFINCPDFLNKRIIFGEGPNGSFMMSGVKKEQDLVEFYVRSKYKNLKIDPSILSAYNEILSQIFNNTPSEDNNKLLSILLSVDCDSACSLVELWNTSTKRAAINDIYKPTIFSGNNNELIMLISRPLSLSNEQFDILLHMALEFYSCKKKTNDVYVFVFQKIEEQTMVQTICIKMNYQLIEKERFDYLSKFFEQ